jgi:hypothetical protein
LIRNQTLIALCGFALLAGCGGGNTNSGGSATPTGGPRGSLPTPTKTRTGSASGFTPTPVPIPTPTVGLIVQPGGNILAILRAASAGSTIVVEPGTYPPLSLQSGDLRDSITLVADTTGQLSGSANMPVTISAGTASGVAVAALEVSGTTGLTLDGFTLEGGSGEALLIFNSPQTTVRNCVVHGSQSDGIFVEGSDQALLFDNLVFDNARTGIRVFGGTDLRVINNTVYNNADNGISIGPDTQIQGVQPPAATVDIINNIVDANTPAGIVVDATTTDYIGNFNLNTDGYGLDTPVGRDDLISNPLFLNPPLDFRLAQASPALNAGDSTIDPALVSMLQQRTTQTDASVDTGAIDLGYHYALPPPTPTPRPRNTRPRNTPTRTPTP